MFAKIIKFLVSTKVIFSPKFVAYYGNYGGGGYTAKKFYDRKNFELYEVEDFRLINKQTVTPDEYVVSVVNDYIECDSLDYIDSCFKVHDIDSCDISFLRIITITNILFMNLSKYNKWFWIYYPLFLPLTIIYFYTIGKQNFTFTTDIKSQLKTVRATEITNSFNKYKIKMI